MHITILKEKLTISNKKCEARIKMEDFHCSRLAIYKLTALSGNFYVYLFYKRLVIELNNASNYYENVGYNTHISIQNSGFMKKKDIKLCEECTSLTMANQGNNFEDEDIRIPQELIPKSAQF